jgi:hypothetical protein
MFMTRHLQEGAERRGGDRLEVLVPATIRCAGNLYTAHLLNVFGKGALIETSAPLAVHSRFSLHCGTVVAAAFAVWRRERHIGVKFLQPLTDAQVAEQVSRTAALRARLQLKDS